MLFPVAGTRLFIANAPTNPTAPPAVGEGLVWVEIGETEAFGTLGGEHELEESHHMGEQNGGYQALKGVHRPSSMQIVLGLDPADPGQTLLFQAYQAREAFPFRMLFPDGVTERRWFALVIRLGEVFDAANNIMRLQAELHPVSQIQR